MGHLRLGNEPPHGLVRRLSVRPLLQHLLRQVVGMSLGLGSCICKIVAVPILLAHAGRQSVQQRLVAGQPLDGPAGLRPERIPRLRPKVGIGAFAKLLAGDAAVLNADTLPLDPLAVGEDHARGCPVEDLHDGCQLGPANRLQSGARPSTAPPHTIAAADDRPSGHTDLRQPRPQAAAVRVIPPAAGHLLRCITGESLPPSQDGGELHRDAMLQGAPRQCRQGRRLGSSKCLLAQRMPPRASPPAVMQIFRLAAEAQT